MKPNRGGRQRLGQKWQAHAMDIGDLHTAERTSIGTAQGSQGKQRDGVKEVG